MLPNVDEIDILNVDIASPQNMYPEVKMSQKLNPEYLALPESVVDPPKRICGVGGRVGTGGHLPHVG